MTETVKEWVAKAEADFATAGRELRASTSPNFDAVCFHAQQSVEKLMKALLIQMEVTPPRTHDLAQLDQLLTPIYPGWTWPVEDLRLLSRAAVSFRYPGETAEHKEASLAFEKCTAMRERLLALLGAGE
ncbi:MAG: HEPN domain-containing protein [bacterium]|nr:HEPN domain-containing protein [bacterium]